MKHQTVRLPQLLWYGNDELELQFPPSWEITVCSMRGGHWLPLREKQVREAFSKPIATEPIRELARGKKEVAILFDDMTRPTRVAEIVPYVLEELHLAGVKDEGIRFIAAVGAHGALDRLDFAKKLGEPALQRFPVYNHNPYENCTFLGHTSRGTPLAVNNEFLSCDFKLGIGCIIPHPLTGFGGGGKIILPGVASLDTITAHHRDLITNFLTRGEDPGIGIATFEENALRLDIAETAKMAGLDIKIDAVINERSQITGLFVGETSAAHTAGVRLAREAYATEPAPGRDIIVLNAYAKANEMTLALPMLGPLLGERGADVVLIANAPEGQVTHYLMRSFGKKIGGRLWSPPTPPPAKIRRLILFTSYIDRAGTDWLASPESVIWAKTWPEVLEKLKETHSEKAKVKVAVVPDATMQYFLT